MCAALQAAQWLPRPHARQATVSQAPQALGCSFANAPVVAVSSTGAAIVGDRCSRFLRQFCEHDWKVHPRTRHLENFDCRYPQSLSGEGKADSRSSGSAWFMAQSVGSVLGLCPSPATLLWPPSKVTYPHCSAAIARLKLESSVVSRHDVGGAGRLDSHDDLPALQAVVAPLECPPPALFRWTPDAVLWPECGSWIRMKCAPGSPCSSIGQQQQPQSNITPNTWSGNEAVQRSFAEAQNWCAGRGKCPRTREGRWLPGPLFFPGCSTAIAQWCDEKGVLEECKYPPPPTALLVALVGMTARTKRFEAQKWAHVSFGSCPDPDHDFLWPWDLDIAQPTGDSELDARDSRSMGNGLSRAASALRETGT